LDEQESTMARRPPIHDMITSRKAPKPVGPYSHAVRVRRPGEMLFVSGQIPIEVPSGKVFTGDIKRQAELALGHLKSIIEDAKFTMDEVVKCTIYMTDLKDFEAVNQVYQKMFVGQTLPARAAVQVAALPKGVHVEVEAIAVKQAASPDELFKDEDLR
jgi:2-iminobutanoate/2-iminopropanoate deaminase